MRDINNVRIIGNNLNNQSNNLILSDVNGCTAANLGPCYTMSNVTIADNYNLGHNCQFGRGEGISINASRGGGNVLVYNNYGRPGGFRECNLNVDTLNIKRPCWVGLSNNPATPNANDNVLLKSTACATSFTNIVFPTATLTSPADGTVVPPNTIVNIIVSPSSNITKLDYWVDATLIGTQLSTDPNFGTLNWTAPQAGLKDYVFSVKATDATQSVFVWTNNNRLMVQDPTILPQDLESGVVFYPNPSSTTFKMKSEKPIGILVIRDVVGKLVLQQAITAADTEINLPNKGIYFVTAGTKTYRVVKQ
jgi:hypothetical protein